MFAPRLDGRVSLRHVLLLPRPVVCWQANGLVRGSDGRSKATIGTCAGSGRTGEGRGMSLLANPYVVGYEREREASGRAYRRLLRTTLVGGGGPGRERVELIGRLAGIGGEVRGWRWESARERLRTLLARRLQVVATCK